MKTKTNTKKSFFHIRFSVLFFNYSMMIAIAILGVYYVLCANSLSVQGYILRDLKTKARDLKEVSAENEIKAMALESYQNINERAKKMKLVKADKIEYLNAVPEAVAKK
jgi:hypothetical protein